MIDRNVFNGHLNLSTVLACFFRLQLDEHFAKHLSAIPNNAAARLARSKPIRSRLVFVAVGRAASSDTSDILYAHSSSFRNA